MSNFTRGYVTKLSNDALEALKKVAEEYGLEVVEKNGRYSNTSFTAKFEFSKPGMSKDVTDFLELAEVYGLEKTDLNKTFTLMTEPGVTYTISGLSPRAKKYPVLAKSSKTGSTYKFPVSTVKMALGRFNNVKESSPSDLFG